MGLDMYLYKKTYVDYYRPEGEPTTLKIEGRYKENIKPERVKYIVEEVGYWRKANQIHNWFENNLETSGGAIENGADNYVSIDTLKRLLEVCKIVKAGSIMVKGMIQNGTTWKPGMDKPEPNMEEGEYIQNPELARKLLPTTNGFFFGSTDYNQWYMQDIDDTIEIIEKLIEEDPDGNGSYYYNADW